MFHNVFMFNTFWYNTLTKPFLNPPSWVFSYAWGILYFMIFLSFIFYAKEKSIISKRKGYIYFILQLIFNFLWTPVFFILNNIPLSVLVILILDALVILNIKSFYKISKLSAYLLVPYLFWILFATYLNISILLLNL